MNILTRMLFYGGSYIVGFAFMLTVNILRAKAYHISRVRAAVYSAISFAFGYFGAWLIGRIFNPLAGLKGWEPGIQVDLIGAVIFTSPLILAAVYAEKAILRQLAKKQKDTGTAAKRDVSFRDTLDLVIIGAFFLFASVKIGCAIRGCCWGVECSWGFYSPYIHETVFPIQVFESLMLLCIVFIVYLIKQTPFYRRGMGGPLSAFFYGIGRFLWEFLRWYAPENRYFLPGLTLWQIFCILILIVAGAWTAILYKTQPSEPMPQSRSYIALKKALVGAKEWLPSFTFKKKKKQIVHAKKKKTGRKKH